MLLIRHFLHQALAICTMTLVILVAVSLLLFLAEALGEIADGRLLASTLLQTLLLRVPEAVLLAAPLALVVGMLMAFGELAQAREFEIARISGARAGRIARMAFGLALTWALALVVLSGWVAPWSQQRQAVLAERMTDDLLLAGIRPGQFETLAGGRVTVYAAGVVPEASRLDAVFVQFRNGDELETIAASSGRLIADGETGRRYLVLEDGEHLGLRDDADGLPMRRIAFASNRIELPLAGAADDSAGPEQATLSMLVGQREPMMRVELMDRLTPALICLVMAAFALPATLSSARGRRFGVVLMAVAAYLVYSNAATLIAARPDPALVVAGLAGLHGGMALLAGGVVWRWWRRW